MQVTGVRGLMARSVVTENVSVEGEVWHNSTSQPGWKWKGDTSSDEVHVHVHVHVCTDIHVHCTLCTQESCIYILNLVCVCFFSLITGLCTCIYMYIPVPCTFYFDLSCFCWSGFVLCYSIVIRCLSTSLA